MKVTLLAIVCLTVVLSTYAAPQSAPKNGNKAPQDNPAKGSQNNPSKVSSNTKNNVGQNKTGSKKVKNSNQPPTGYNGPPTGNNGQAYNENSVDVKKTYSRRAGNSAFYK